MKKKIMFGSLLAVFLMIMLPIISAIESDTVKETMKSKYIITIPDIDIEESKIKYQNDPEPTFFLIFILKQILNLLRTIKFTALFAILLAIIKSISGSTSTIVS
ncbi:MAG: hypothetical protein JSW06_11055 [Thermoplasmatales archaeon]|nr:MAG: hypothetical protein JSW06_11055 [Thermoplasmatales archaeon]